MLQFNQGVISSDYLAESRIEHLGWGASIVEHTNEAVPVSGQVTVKYGNENIEDEMEFEEPSGWLLSHDIRNIWIFSWLCYFPCHLSSDFVPKMP